MTTIIVLDFLLGILCITTVTALYFTKDYHLPLPPGPPRVAVWGSLASIVHDFFIFINQLARFSMAVDQHAHLR